jgi:hypothetical protein
MSREIILESVRTALGRSAGQAPAAPPEVRLRIPETGVEERIGSSGARGKVGGKFHVAASKQDARARWWPV